LSTPKNGGSCTEGLTGFKEELSQLRADLEREQTSRKVPLFKHGSIFSSLPRRYSQIKVGQSQQLNSKNGNTFETVKDSNFYNNNKNNNNNNNSNNSNSDNNNDNNKNNNKINNYI